MPIRRFNVKSSAEVRRALQGLREVHKPYTFESYDASGNAIIGSSFSTVAFAAQRTNSEETVFEYNAGEITINEDGTFEFDVRVTVGNADANEIMIILEKDDGTGWSEVPGSRAFIWR